MRTRESWIPPRAIDRGSPIPFYYQLQELLKQEIESGRWLPGELLPSEDEMGRALRVSRPVIRQALDILEGDGQVIRVRGKGTLVAQPKLRYEAVTAVAAWAGGVYVTPRLDRVVAVHLEPAVGHIARLLDLQASDDVFELTYTHSVDGTPASITTLTLRGDSLRGLRPGQLPALEEGGPDALLQLNAAYGLAVVASELTIEATRTNGFEADLLHIDIGAPVFLLGSLEMGATQKPLGFSRTVVRSDQFRFAAVINHEGVALTPQFLAEPRPAATNWVPAEPVRAADH